MLGFLEKEAALVKGGFPRYCSFVGMPEFRANATLGLLVRQEKFTWVCEEIIPFARVVYGCTPHKAGPSAGGRCDSGMGRSVRPPCPLKADVHSTGEA